MYDFGIIGTVMDRKCRLCFLGDFLFFVFVFVLRERERERERDATSIL